MDPTNPPSPPSPITSSPGLTQSISNSSSSPPQPMTPPRQSRQRYLDLGRVPLHRRGTSNTYERLEDLLREAGYKETRIFTPESERLEARREGGNGDNLQSDGKKQGVGAAVVGFLTGLVTGGTGTAAQLRQHQQGSDYNPDQRPRLSRTQSPSSPLANKHPQRRESSRSAESSEPQTPYMTSSIESLSDPTPKAPRRQPHPCPVSPVQQTQLPSRPSTPTASAYPTYHTPHQNKYHRPSTPHLPPSAQHHRLSAAQRQLQKQASTSSFRTQTSSVNLPYNQGTIPSKHDIATNNNANVIHQPRPSRAGAYLRHMVSASSIHPPPRPNSTPVRTQAHGFGQPQNRSPHDDSDATTDAETSQPALPRKWLDSVARAILLGVVTTPFSSSDAPNPLPPSSSTTAEPQAPSYPRTLRATRSSLSQTTLARSSKASTTTRRSRLSDQTNIAPTFQTLAPPALFTRLERGRAPCAQGQVLKAQVVCRSAPGSRASSLARENSGIGIPRDKMIDGGKSGASAGRLARRQHGSSGGARAGGSRGKINRRKKDDREKPCVPSLARTHVEGDGWHGSTLPRVRAAGKGKFRSGGCFSDDNGDGFAYDDDYSSGYDDDEEEDDDEDEGELDLARMLIPPKRQQSIRSLRKHLHQLTSPSATDVSSAKLNPSLSGLHNSSSHPALRQGGRSSSGTQVRLSGMQEEDGDGDWERQWRRGGFNGRRGSEDDEAENFAWLRDGRGDNGSQRSTAKVRLGLPGPWKASGNAQGYR